MADTDTERPSQPAGAGAGLLRRRTSVKRSSGPWRVRPPIERRGLAWLLISAVRAAPLALIAGVLVAAVAVAAGRVGGEGATTTTRLALTDEVVWPFFDPVTERISELARDDELIETLDAQYPDADFTMEANPPEVLRAIVELVVSADDKVTAEAISEMAASWITDRHESPRVEAQQQVVDSLRAERDVIASQLARDEAEATLLRQALENAGDGVALVEEVRLNLLVVNDAIRAGNDALFDLDNDIRDAERALAALRPEVIVASVQTAESEADEGLGFPLAAGMGAAALVGLATIVYDRERGRIWSADQLADITEVTTVSFGAAPSLIVARALRAVESDGRETIVAVEMAGHMPLAARLVAELHVFGVEAEHRLSLAGAGRGSLVPKNTTPDRLQLADMWTDGHFPTDLLACTAVVVVARQRSDKIADVQKRLRQYEDLGFAVPVILLIRS